MVRESLPNGDAPLADSTALAIVFGKIHEQRMFGSLSHEFVARWVIHRIVPVEVQAWIIIAVIWFAFPIARQPYRVWCFVETSIANQFSGQSALHAFKHKFIKLAVEHRAYLTLDPIRIDLYGCDGWASLILGSKRRPSEIETAEN
jgi:hypothetical protein